MFQISFFNCLGYVRFPSEHDNPGVDRPEHKNLADDKCEHVCLRGTIMGRAKIALFGQEKGPHISLLSGIIGHSSLLHLF